MTSAENTFKDILRANHQSVTKARSQVFAALLDEPPMGMSELVSRVNAADRASVYRAIELFEKLGIVQRINIGWKFKLELSEKFTDHHHHLTCSNCGKITPLNEATLEKAIEQLSAQQGFLPTAHQIEIQGLCASCKKTN